MTDTFTLRDYHPDDYNWLFALRNMSYRDVVVRQFGEWDETDQRQIYLDNWAPQFIKIVMVDTQPIGMVSTETMDECIFLNEIQILPSWQSQGVGTSFIQQLQNMAKADGRYVKLQVLFENSRAKQLYERLGFAVIDKTQTHWVMCDSG